MEVCSCFRRARQRLSKSTVFLKFARILKFIKIREFREFLKFIKFEFSVYADHFMANKDVDLYFVPHNRWHVAQRTSLMTLAAVH